MHRPQLSSAVPAAVRAAFGLLLGACAQGVVGAPPPTPGASGGGNSSIGGSTGAGGAPSITIGPWDAPPAGGSSGGTTTEVVACTDGPGCNCSTLSVAVIGKPGKVGRQSRRRERHRSARLAELAAREPRRLTTTPPEPKNAHPGLLGALQRHHLGLALRRFECRTLLDVR